VDRPESESFERNVLPHLDAAYRLARWLMRNDHDAEDVVQEASLRALKYFRSFDGRDARAWLLRIVRNVCHTAHARNRVRHEVFDEELHPTTQDVSDQALASRIDDQGLIARVLDRLPERFRTVLILREIEGLSYRELADAIGISAGSVMSGLSRARRAFRDAAVSELGQIAQRLPGPARRFSGVLDGRPLARADSAKRSRPHEIGRNIPGQREVTSVRRDEAIHAAKPAAAKRKARSMFRKAALIAAAVGMVAQVTAQERTPLVRFDGGIGVQPVSNVAGSANADGTFPNVRQNVVRGVSPAGPWRIASLKASIYTDGSITVRGRGFLLAAGNSIGQNANQRVFATLICEATAPFVERSTSFAGIPLEPNGDFRIDDTLSPAPADCASPVLLIRTSSNGTWFAAGIQQIGDDDQ
jgi:RNA polymerase sigma-70 factor, ECF subfamily